MKRILPSLVTLVTVTAVSTGCGSSASSPSAALASDPSPRYKIELASASDRGAPTRITLDYLIDDAVEPSNRQTYFAEDLVIRVENPNYLAGSSVRAVLMSLCSVNGGTPYLARSLELDIPYTHLRSGSGFGYELQWNGSLTLQDDYHGGSDTFCTQELAVVVDGNWLTDPVNGTHNFKFNMERGGVD